MAAGTDLCNELSVTRDSPDSPAGEDGPRRPRWLASLVVVTAVAVLGTYLINRHLGDPLSGQTPHSLRILTWNLGKVYQAKWDSRASDDDLDHVAEVIRAVNPHVVALQELHGPRQLGRLAALLGRGWRAKVSEDAYDRRAGLLVRLEARFVSLPTSSGRIAQGAVITAPGGGVFSVASVHLDAFDADRRLLQAEEVLAGLRRLVPTDLLLVGDFNFDPAVVAQDSVDHQLYHFLTRELSDAGRSAGATSVISQRLDYVFYRSARVQRSSAEVLRGKRIGIMDHDPLLVELHLAPFKPKTQ